MQEDIYNSFYCGLINFKKQIKLKGFVDYKDMFSKVVNSRPELFFVGKSFTQEPVVNGAMIRPQYVYNEGQVQMINQKLNIIANQIILKNINSHQSDYDKVLVLHDYLKASIKYDKQAAGSNNIKYHNAYNIIGALVDKKCVCSGFALAMKYLCDKVGVECLVVEGIADNGENIENHAWNIVKINGYYHHVDVTWDNQFASDSEIENYAYLNIDDKTLSKDHNWNKKDYPACPIAPYNYFYFNKALMENKIQLERYIYQNMMDLNEHILFKVRENSKLKNELSVSIDRIVHKAAKKCKNVKIKNWKYVYIKKQLIYTLVVEYK